MRTSLARVSLVVASCVFSCASSARAEAPSTRITHLTLGDAVARAISAHPSLRASKAAERVADARIDEARARELPAVGVSAEINRSTGNTVPGAFFSANGFVPIAGPTRGRTLDGGDFQTGASLWASWEVTSLLRQARAIDVRLASRVEAEEATRARELEIAYAAADAFIAALAARETKRAAAASLDRARVFQKVVQALVDQSLRPGVDGARADAEVARAETALARAEESEALRLADLSEAMGGVDGVLAPDAGALLDPADEVRAPRPTSIEKHPLVRQRAKSIDVAEAERAAVRVEFLPRVDLLASAWLRGSGSFASPADGLVPDVPNWAAGAVATWNVLELPAINARARAAEAREDAAVADRDAAALTITSEVRSASAILDGSIRVAQTTPKALASSRAAEEQIVARYQAGLAQAVEVADAERALAQAEADDAVARLDVRRAALLVARAAGDLEPFLRGARGGR